MWHFFYLEIVWNVFFLCFVIFLPCETGERRGEKKGNVVAALFGGSPLSVGEKARSYQREHPSKQLLLWRNVHLRSILWPWPWLRSMAYRDFCPQSPRASSFALATSFRHGACAGSCDWDFVKRFWTKCLSDLGLMWICCGTEAAPKMGNEWASSLGLCFLICRMRRGESLRSLLDELSRDSRTSLLPNPLWY